MSDELVVLPCENELFEYSGKFEDVRELSQDGQILKISGILGKVPAGSGLLLFLSG